MEAHSTHRLLEEELKNIINSEAQTNLMEVLKTKAINIEIWKRDHFENCLLALAQAPKNKAIRPVLYEIMVSLQSFWEKDKPKMGLIKKFRQSIDENKSDIASTNYKELNNQGLDYISSQQIKEGSLTAITIGGEDLLLHYNPTEINFYTLQLEHLKEPGPLQMPEGLKIVDLLVLPTISDGLSEKNDIEGKIWFLLENKTGSKRIFSINLETIDILNSDRQSFEDRAIELDEEKSKCQNISYHNNRLLILFKNSVYYYIRNEGWEKWYVNEDSEISAFASTPKGFWIGHADGKILILKDFNWVGIREKFQEYTESIQGMQRQEDFVLAYGKNCFCLSDHAGNLTLPHKETNSNIIKASLLSKECAYLHLSNGMLVAYELKHGNIVWKINLGDIFETVFSTRKYVYCSKRDGVTMLFVIPDFNSLAGELKRAGVYVDREQTKRGLHLPVKYFSDFIGRRDILQKIKDSSTTHFFIHGTPKSGKSSLLNVLSDTLSENSRCCYIDLTQLLKDAESFSKFEEIFFEKCLNQHSFDLDHLTSKVGFQAFSSVVKLIKGTKKFCVICLDNYLVPDNFSEEDFGKFITFMRDMFIQRVVRVVFTCNTKDKAHINKFFENFNDIFAQRKLIPEEMHLFSDIETKNAIRSKIVQDQDIVDNIFEYIGNFPHLVHLFDNWNSLKEPVEVYSKEIAKQYWEIILDYFRDLSPDAFLLITTFFKYNLMNDKISYSTFHRNFPFFKYSISREQQEKILHEIAGYSDNFSVNSEKEYFQISMKCGAHFFSEASQHVPWVKHFDTLYKFTTSPKLDTAQQVSKMFAKITGSELDSSILLGPLVEKYKKHFHIINLTEDGRNTLEMPLTTFIVIPLSSWETKPLKRVFNDLYVAMQHFMLQYSKSVKENIIQKFYVLLFELHGVSAQKVKGDLIGLERISIITATNLKNIILDKSPKEKAPEYIFGQLSIKERSPYTTAGAVPNELFFGREMEMQLIRGLPENIGIFGTRTIGKTSLLRKLTRDLNPLDKWRVISIDCARIEGEEALLKNLSEKMSISFDTISNIEKFRKYVTSEAARIGKQFLFLLDEVDRLVEYDLENDEIIFNTFNRLCTEPMDNDEIAARFILFGFHQMFEQMKNSTSRLYNFMVFLPLKPLDVTSAMALVTKPIEKIRVRWKDKDEDASYLVDSCSSHPRLLQAACHSLLSILDGKKKNKDIIERSDVDQALSSAEFREICMRFYGNPQANIVKKKKKMFSKFHFKHLKEDGSEKGVTPKTGRKFLNDLHRITILSSIRLYFEEDRETFTINDIQTELEKIGVPVSPDVMRTILDHLCLSGNFNLKDETTLLAAKDSNVFENTVSKSLIKNNKLVIETPDVYKTDKSLPSFKYEFGVKIFPRLLVAQFGGIDQCKEELQKLIQKGEWKEWIGRY